METDLTWWDALQRVGADHRPFLVASAHTGATTEVLLAASGQSRYDAVRFALAPGADLDQRIERALVCEGTSWALVSELIDLQLLVEDAVGVPVDGPMSAGGAAGAVPVEAALLIAQAVREGDPARLEACLEVVGWTQVPDWLRDLSFGLSGQLVVTTLRPGRSGEAAISLGRQLGSGGVATGSTDVLRAVGLTDGWGLLCADGEAMVRFEPVDALELQAALTAVCRRLNRREAA